SLIITLKYSIWCSFMSIMATSDASILFDTPPNCLILIKLAFSTLALSLIRLNRWLSAPNNAIIDDQL
ncbi:hypothetical protein, partial [Psychrobacter faecalis]|uniref:hypothetical protein n=1 Tax=Psychrobacter faecalis TaxID=180588 RepID=UPI0028AE48BA